MKIQDIFLYGFNAIRRKKSRNILAILGVAIGIAAIISLDSLGSGFQEMVDLQFQRGFSSDTLIVTTRGIDFFLPESDIDLYSNDSDIIEQIDHVQNAASQIQRNCYYETNNDSFIFTVIGVNYSKYTEIFPETFTAEQGTIPLNPDNDTLIIGKRVQDPWANGTETATINDYVNITWTTRSGSFLVNKTFRGQITAVLNEIGAASIGGPTDSIIYIPLFQAEEFFETTIADNILVQLDNDDQQVIQQVAAEIEDLYDGQIQVVVPSALLNAISEIITSIETFLAIVAMISLIVAGVGIMNIMLTTVLERVREIGILKALGMRRRTVLGIFLTESLIIGILGAFAGIIMGWILALALGELGVGNFIAQSISGTFVGQLIIRPVLDPYLIINSILFGMVVAVIFGLYPAWRAARMKPVEALRQ